MAQGDQQEHDEEPPIKRTPVEARQGGRSLTSLRVLLRSFVIAVVLMVLLYFLFFPRGA